MQDEVWIPLLGNNARLKSKVVHISSMLIGKLFESNLSSKRAIGSPKMINNFSLARGDDSDFALVAGMLDNINHTEGWDIIAHKYLSSAAQKIKNEISRPGLFSGLAGAAFVAMYLSKNHTRYNTFLLTLNKIIYKKTLILSDAINKSDTGVGTVDFDLISGITGIGAYLLYNADKNSLKYLRIILSALINNVSKNDDLLGFYTPYKDQFKWKRDLYKYGTIDLGVSHGIAGPLALLSISKLSGINILGLNNAITKIGEWFIQHSQKDRYGINWPSVIPVEPSNKDSNLHDNARLSKLHLSKSAPVSRTAWCYGAPGISRALYLAGKAVTGEQFINFSLKAIKSAFRRPLEYGRLDSPTFCHGLAGILQINARFYNDTQDDFFRKSGIHILNELLSKYNESFKFGYRNTVLNNKTEDDPTLLEGVSGIILSLYSTFINLEPKWDRLFLLS